MMADRLLLLFTKPAEPGKVKTRLIGALSPREAAELHAALLDDLVDRLREGAFELRLAWAVDTGEQIPDAPVPGIRQQGKNLGDRLFNALLEAASEASTVCAVGSDHPELTAGNVESAFEALESGRADVVVGPALDGGYYLIGVRAAALSAELFRDIPWSTADVRARTLERCESLGLRCHQLAEASDVDTPADLERLARTVGADRVSSPRTAALLRSWGRVLQEDS